MSEFISRTKFSQSRLRNLQFRQAEQQVMS